MKLIIVVVDEKEVEICYWLFVFEFYDGIEKFFLMFFFYGVGECGDEFVKVK